MKFCFVYERVTGIEPALSAWEADVLPLNYTRMVSFCLCEYRAFSFDKENLLCFIA